MSAEEEQYDEGSSVQPGAPTPIAALELSHYPPPGVQGD